MQLTQKKPRKVLTPAGRKTQPGFGQRPPLEVAPSEKVCLLSPPPPALLLLSRRPPALLRLGSSGSSLLSLLRKGPFIILAALPCGVRRLFWSPQAAQRWQINKGTGGKASGGGDGNARSQLLQNPRASGRARGRGSTCFRAAPEFLSPRSRARLP